MTGVIRVLLIDDDPLVRAGLSMILGAADDIEVVGEAADGTEAVAAVAAHRPDVVLMDIRMPRLDGLAATAQVVALPAAPKVVVLTTFHLDEYVYGALQAGASGFLLKDTPPRALIDAVRVVAAGEAMLSPAVTRRLITDVAERLTPPRDERADRALARLADLTDREREVAVAVAEGKSNAEVARALYLSEATVKAHLTHIFTKTGVTNRVQLAIVAHDAGLID